MDFSYILKSAKYDETLLLKYGFKKSEASDPYSLTKTFSVAGNDFYVIFEISESSFSGRIVEQESDDIYALAEVPSAAEELTDFCSRESKSYGFSIIVDSSFCSSGLS